MKKSVKLIILLVTLAIAAGGYVLLQHSNEQAAVSEASGQFPLTEKTADDVTGLSWIYKDVQFTFAKQEDTWVNSLNAAYPVSQSQLETLAKVIPDLTADRQLESVTSLADYGLEEPDFTILVQYSDGTEVSYQLGSATPFADGYYTYRTDDPDHLYIISTKFSTKFARTMTELAEKETIPDAGEANRLVVEGVLDITYKADAQTIYSAQNWFATESGEALGKSTCDSILSSVKKITWKELIEPVADEDALASYGLDEQNAKRISLYADETETRCLLVGNTDDDGNYYARLPGSSMVYTISSSSLTTLLGCTNESLYLTTPLAVSYDDLTSITLTAANQEWAITRTEEVIPAAEDGAEETISVLQTLNGTAYEGTGLSDLISQMAALTATSRLNENAGGNAVLSITLTTENGCTAQFDFLEYDASSYALPLRDGVTLLFDAAGVDKLIRTLKYL